MKNLRDIRMTSSKQFKRKKRPKQCANVPEAIGILLNADDRKDQEPESAEQPIVKNIWGIKKSYPYRVVKSVLRKNDCDLFSYRLLTINTGDIEEMTMSLQSNLSCLEIMVIDINCDPVYFEPLLAIVFGEAGSDGFEEIYFKQTVYDALGHHRGTLGPYGFAWTEGDLYTAFVIG